MADYKFWLPFVVSIVYLLLLYQQTKLMKAQASTSLDSSGRNAGVIKRYWHFLVMVLLLAACWVPYFLSSRTPQPTSQAAPQSRAIPAAPLTLGWGVAGNNCYVVVDTSLITDSKEQYDIILACGVVDPTVDPLMDKQIIVSGPFNVSGGQQEMAAAFTAEFEKRIKAQSLPVRGGQKTLQIWYREFLMPKNSDLSRIRSLSDVPTLGGKLFP